MGNDLSQAELSSRRTFRHQSSKNLAQTPHCEAGSAGSSAEGAQVRWSQRPGLLNLRTAGGSADRVFNQNASKDDFI